jgi:hypothetical protein
MWDRRATSSSSSSRTRASLSGFLCSWFPPATIADFWGPSRQSCHLPARVELNKPRANPAEITPPNSSSARTLGSYKSRRGLALWSSLRPRLGFRGLCWGSLVRAIPSAGAIGGWGACDFSPVLLRRRGLALRRGLLRLSLFRRWEPSAKSSPIDSSQSSLGVEPMGSKNRSSGVRTGHHHFWTLPYRSVGQPRLHPSLGKSSPNRLASVPIFMPPSSNPGLDVTGGSSWCARRRWALGVASFGHQEVEDKHGPSDWWWAPTIRPLRIPSPDWLPIVRF